MNSAVNGHERDQEKKEEIDLESKIQKFESERDIRKLPSFIFSKDGEDGGYGWVIVFAVFFVHVFVVGNFYSFGVFYTAYLDYFDDGAAAIAWVGSIGACLMCGLGVYTGKLADYYGNNIMVFVGGLFIAGGYFLASFSTEVWHLYLTQGILTGTGYSCAFIAGISVVGPWFTKNRGLAVGIAVAGSGLGQFAMSMITGNLIEQFGWRTALRYLSLIEIIGITLCALLIKRKTALVATWSSKAESSLQYFKDRNFSLLFCGGLLVSLGYLVPFTYLPAYSEQYGITKSNAVFILSMIGISSAVGRISTGYLADNMGKLLMLQVCYGGSGIATLCWLVCWDFTSLLIMGLVFGFCCGGVISLLPSVAAELYGIKKLASILGLLYSSVAIGNLLCAPIAGFLLQSYHSYDPPIITAGCFQLSSLLLVSFIRLDNKKITTNKIVVEPAADKIEENGKTENEMTNQIENEEEEKAKIQRRKEYEMVANTYAEEFEF